MALYLERCPSPGRLPRRVQAVRILTDEQGILDVFAFLEGAWESVEVLDHPPRVRMSHKGRSFTACQGEWIVNPAKGAYLKMGNDRFSMLYDEASD